MQKYIEHHLTNFTIGEGFWALNVDTVFWSSLLGVLFLTVFYRAAQALKSPTDVPGRFQTFIQMIVETVDGAVRQTTNADRFIGPLALSIFVWVFLMNLMDLIPVDWIPGLASLVGFEYHSPVGTSDLNTTLGIACSVVLIMIGYGFKTHGLKFVKQFTHHPMQSKNKYAQIALIPFNMFLEIVGLLAKPMSLSMRLFGNIYAGEMVFILIAAMYGEAMLMNAMGVVAQFVWAVLHILVIFLQAFIFMMLTIVYLGQVREKNEH